MSWNVWSIANEEKLCNFLQILEDNQIDIACITETWFDRKTGPFSKTIKEAGYAIHHAYREGKRGGGSAIIYKKTLSVKKGEASASEYTSFEFSYVTITLTSGRKLLLVCLYRKQEIHVNIFLDEMSSFMDIISRKDGAMLVVGDFNVWADETDGKESCDVMDLMNSYGLIQTVDEPTNRSGHTLDHVYLNPYQLETEQHITSEPLGLTTDHYPNFMNIPTGNSENTTKTVCSRKLKEIDMNEFRRDLQTSIEGIDSVQTDFAEHVAQFNQNARKVMDEHAPLLTWNKRTNGPIWMDNEYRRNRALRRKYERTWKRSRTDTNRTNYIQQKKLCVEMALEKQTAHYTKLVEDAGSCQKTLFKVANELLDKNEDRVLPPHSDSKQLANEFNQFYVDKVKKIRKSIPTVTPTAHPRPFQGEQLLVFEPTTIEELTELMKEFGVKTSVEDPIPAKLIKSVTDILLPTYTILINKSLAEGSMVNVKSSVIDPLLKKAGLEIEKNVNYRPVNNLPFFSKLIERVVKKRLEGHMTTNALHEPSQFAYKSNHNTETMMIELCDEVLLGFDENLATVIIFLDLSAAFDTIDPDKLTQILHEELGIGGVALLWFRSFLTGRTQRVKINNEYSDSLEVPCGVPQGSILGPILFNINVRSQPRVFRHCKFNTASFADDSNGRRQFALKFQFQVLKNGVVDCLKDIVEWSYAHFMKINPDKTEILLLFPDSLRKEVMIRGVIFDGQCIRFSNCVKNVGVWIDQNLNLKKHVNNIVSHSFKILKDVGRIKKNLTKSHLKNLVHAVISSRLDYCNGILINIEKQVLYKLQKVQNAAARLILGRRRRESAKMALHELHWLNVEARIVYKVLLLVFKWKIGVASENLQLKYKSFYGRESDFLMLETPHFKTKYGKRTFRYNGPRLWNALSEPMRREKDIAIFKKDLKTLLFVGCEELKKRAYMYNH